MASFALGWIPGELPLHMVGPRGRRHRGLRRQRSLAGWPGWVGLVVAVLAGAGFIRLAVVAARPAPWWTRPWSGPPGEP